MSDKFNNENRKFLHDIATPITVLKLMIKSISNSLSQDQLEKNDKLKNAIQRAQSAIAKIEELHANYKAEISARPKTDKAA
jgi:hypothetical protein